MCPRYVGFLLVAIGGGVLVVVAVTVVALSRVYQLAVSSQTVMLGMFGGPLLMMLVGAVILLGKKRKA